MGAPIWSPVICSLMQSLLPHKGRTKVCPTVLPSYPCSKLQLFLSFLPSFFSFCICVCGGGSPWLTLWLSRRVLGTMDQRMDEWQASLVKEFWLTSHDAMNHLLVREKGIIFVSKSLWVPGADDCMSEYNHASPVWAHHHTLYSLHMLLKGTHGMTNSNNFLFLDNKRLVVDPIVEIILPWMILTFPFWGWCRYTWICFWNRSWVISYLTGSLFICERVLLLQP